MPSAEELAAAKIYLDGYALSYACGKRFNVVHHEDGSVTITDLNSGTEKTITVAQVATEFGRRV